MARLWSCGFEQQSASSGVEWDTTVGSPTINTTIKRSGAASLRCNPTAATAYIQQEMLAADNTVRMFLRAYIYIATMPSAKTTLLSWGDSTPFWFGARLNTNGTITVESQDSAQISSASSLVLTTGRWYRIELDYDDVNNIGTAYVDGAQVAQLTGADLFGGRFARWGVQDTCTTDIYFDDIAINDTAGTAQNSLPGSGKIVHLRPNAAGASNGWATAVGGTAGSANNFTRVNETPPNDATSYNQTTATGTTLFDELNVTDRSTAGISLNDTVTLVQVGVRAGSNAVTAANMIVRLRGQSGGTTQNTTINVNVNGWFTNATVAPRIYPVTAYVNPQGSAAWTPAALDNIQIGYGQATSQTTARRVTNIWALVEYVEAQPTVRGGTPTTAVSTSSTVSATLTGTKQPQNGDTLLIIHANNYYTTGTMPTPTVGGSTTNVTQRAVVDGGTNNAHIKAYTYPVTSTGDVTVSVTETGEALEEKLLVVYVLSGVMSGNPIDGVPVGSFSAVGQSTYVLDGVTTGQEESMLVLHHNSGGGSSASTPMTPPAAPFVELYDTSTGGLAYAGGTERLGGKGATGSRTFTSGGSVTWAGLAIAVRGVRDTTTTTVTSDADLRWAVLSGSTTTVTSDVDLRWQVKNTVTSDADLRWRVFNRITSDVDLRWQVKNAVTQDVDLRWAVRSVVTSDVDLRWRVTNRITQDLDLRWVSRAQVTSDADLRWRTRVIVTSDADLRWRVLNQITQDVDLRWTSRAQVTNDLDLRWAIAGPVTNDLDLRWAVRAAVAQTVDLRWAVRNVVTTDLDVRWGMPGVVSSDLDLRWRVANRITNDLDARWAVRSVVTSDADLRWAVRAVVTADADLRWRVRNEVSNGLDVLWRVRSTVSNDADLRWAVLAGLTQNVDMRWRVMGLATQTVDLRWVVNSSSVTVTSDLDLRWRVRAIVSGDLDVRWRNLEQVSNGLDVRWAVRAVVAQDLAALWAVRQVVTTTADLRWAVLVGLSTDCDLRWRVLALVANTLDLRWVSEASPLPTTPSPADVRNVRLEERVPAVLTERVTARRMTQVVQAYLRSYN